LIIGAAMSGGCTPPVPEAAPARLRVVVGGPPPSQPYRFGIALAEAVGKRSGLTFATDGSADTVATMQLLHDDKADPRFAFGDAAYLAFMAAIGSRDTPLNRVRAISVLQPRPLHVLVSPRSDIRRVADLRGRRVAINPQDLSAPFVLEAFG